MRGLRLLLLGRPRLEFDGQPLTRLIAPKHQALVFYLAVQGTPVSRSELATLLWEELDESAARANLRVALTRLRRWLPGLLDIDAHQVGFAADAPREVDLDALRAALDPALPTATRAVAVRAWRGPLLEAFELDGADGFEHWITTARQRAQRDAVTLRHALVAEAIQAGQAGEAMEHLRALLDMDDIDERAHMRLMEVLAACGQRTAAIAQYEACRAALAERVGARPSAPCYALYVKIHADASPPAATLASPARHAHALPIDDGRPFIGRDAELAVVGERLADAQCRWLTLVGPGGVGKTRLARAAAERFGPGFRQGVLWLSGRDPGGPLQDADALARHVLERVGADRDAPGALLLVLDNLEAVPNGRAMAQALNAHGAGICVLATSRRRLGGSREWLLELCGLSLVRDPSAVPVASPAARLLTLLARRLDPGFDLAAQTGDAEQLCELVGGLPLALSLAARSIHRIGLRGVIERLRAGEPLADPGADPLEDRHHLSLGVVLQESWAALDPGARQAALRLAWLPGRFDMALAAAVGAAPGDVDILREHSWLTRDREGHLALHPLQQDDLRRRASDSLLHPEVRQALVAHQRAALPAVLPFGSWPASAEAATRLADLPAFGAPELAEALDHLLAGAPTEALADWLDPVIALLVAVGRTAEAAALLARAAPHADLPDWRAGGWLLRQGEILNAMGKGEDARRVLKRALSRLGLNPLPTGNGTAQGLPQAAWRMLALRGFPLAARERMAFCRLLLRSLMFLAQQQTFAPHTFASVRTMALASVLAQRTGGKAERLATRVSNAYGATLFGSPGLAWALSRGLTHRPPIHHDALLEAFIVHTHCALQLVLGEWDGLAQRIDACEQVFVQHRDHRHEMEAISLGGKLLFYQGHLGAASARFSLCQARGLQLPAGAYRAFGPFGLAEVSLCLDHAPLAQLQLLAQVGAHWISEMENMDTAYVLRRLGLQARLAWRAGDLAQARETVMAGVAAAARFKRCGFWAHEGYAGIGEGLVRLYQHERETSGPLPPLDRAWSSFQQALEGHVRRFPPASAMQQRLLGQVMLERGQMDRARRHLLRAVRDAELRGMRIELARSCDVLGVCDPDGQWAGRAGRLWADIRGPTSALP